MTNINQLSPHGRQCIKENILAATVGAFSGYMYSRLAALPRNVLMTSFAVAMAAEHALFCLVNATIKDRTYKAIAKVAILTVVPKLALDYLSRNGILHPHMMHAIVVVHAALVVYQIFSYLKDRPDTSTWKKPVRVDSEEVILNGKTKL